jgi:hypothetical protein
MEIEGNEEADRQAKKAAEGNTDSPTHRLPKVLRKGLPNSKSAIKQDLNKHLKIEATTTLHKSPQWAKLAGIDPSMPSARYRETVEWLPRKHTSLLIQLRTGHAPLNKHLYTIKCADSPVCSACEDAFETVHHFLIACPAHEPYRRALAHKLGRESRELTTLLSHPKALKPLFHYITRTRRFKETHGDLEIPDTPNNSA